MVDIDAFDTVEIVDVVVGASVEITLGDVVVVEAAVVTNGD